MLNYLYAKFKENPYVGTGVSNPLQHFNLATSQPLHILSDG